MNVPSMNVHNLMEDMVWNQLVDLLQEKSEICKCVNCKNDILALALNQLPPRYIATRNGELYTKVSLLESQYHTDILTALVKAIQVVTEHPSHSDSPSF